jgi:YD repeat-containing protein
MLIKNLKHILVAVCTISVLIACGDKNSPSDLPSPEITSVDPDSAAPGEVVTVKGNNFGNDSTQIKITIDGQVGAIVSASAGQVSFKVPTLAPNSYELLAELSGRKSASKTFVVKQVVQTNPAPLPVISAAPKPSISSIAPQSGFVDSDATIQGLNFGTDQSKISLEIGGQIATVKAFSSTSLTFAIPSSLVAGSYSVKLTVDAQVVTTQFKVTVPVPPTVGVIVLTVGDLTRTTPGGKITLNATVSGSNSLVNWSVSGGAGTLSSASGPSTVFTANAVTDTTTLQVTATLASDSSKSYPVELTVNPIVQPLVTVAGSVDGILAVKTNGDLYAWGANNAGQVGDGTTANRSTPTMVLTDVSSVAGGGAFSMALRTDANVWAWGNNDFGQLGDGTKTSRSTPAIVSGLNNIRAITAGQVFSSALKIDGTVWTWGTNADGRLGRNLATDVYPIPAQVPGLANVIAVASGYSHTLAVKTDGTVWAWGYNGSGQLGESTSNLIRNAPVQVQGLPAIAAVAAGADHSLAIGRDGRLWAWGKNESGQLGDGSTSNSNTPKLISSMTGVKAIASRTHTSLAVKADGSLWTFGANPLAQIGNGSSINALQPTKVLESVALPVGGGPFSAALKTDGSLAICGNNSWGELGNGAAVWHNSSCIG